MGSLKEFDENSKPRERLIRYGPSALSDAELLALILSVGIKGTDVVSFSQKLISQFNGIVNLSKTDYSDLDKICGLKKAKASKLLAVFELARRLNVYSDSGKILDSTESLVQFAKESILSNDKEVIFGIFLDENNQLLKGKVISSGGTLNVTLPLNEIIKECVAAKAAKIVLIHTHTSSDCKPSRQDLLSTTDLILSLVILGIQLEDHIILSEESHFSFKDNKLL